MIGVDRDRGQCILHGCVEFFLLLADCGTKHAIRVAGVPDETQPLQEGEIFLRIRPLGADATVVTGPCTIYRNPCCEHQSLVRVRCAFDYDIVQCIQET